MSFDPRHLTQPFLSLSDKMREERVMQKAAQLFAKLPFVRHVVAMWFAVADPQTPLKPKATLLFALAYFVMPFDLIPDFVAGLGYGDDAAVVFGALRAVRGLVKEEHYQKADAKLAEWRGNLTSARGPIVDMPLN